LGKEIELMHIDTATKPIGENTAYSALEPLLRDSTAVC
jgi:hypothetical protein